MPEQNITPEMVIIRKYDTVVGFYGKIYRERRISQNLQERLFLELFLVSIKDAYFNRLSSTKSGFFSGCGTVNASYQSFTSCCQDDLSGAYSLKKKKKKLS